MKWLNARIVGCERAQDGTLVANMQIHIRWWHPSFWRELHSMIEVEPSWLAWPLIAWFVVTRGWRINKGIAQ